MATQKHLPKSFAGLKTQHIKPDGAPNNVRNVGFGVPLTHQQQLKLDAIVGAINMKMAASAGFSMPGRTLYWSRRSMMSKLIVDYLEGVADPEAEARRVLKDLADRSLKAPRQVRG